MPFEFGQNESAPTITSQGKEGEYPEAERLSHRIEQSVLNLLPYRETPPAHSNLL